MDIRDCAQHVAAVLQSLCYNMYNSSPENIVAKLKYPVLYHAGSYANITQVWNMFIRPCS